MDEKRQTCQHPSVGKEYIGGMDTGDKICDSCRAVLTRAEWLGDDGK